LLPQKTLQQKSAFKKGMSSIHYFITTKRINGVKEIFKERKTYNEIKQMQGKHSSTDKLINKAMPEVLVYAMIVIKNSFLKHEPKE